MDSSDSFDDAQMDAELKQLEEDAEPKKAAVRVEKKQSAEKKERTPRKKNIEKEVIGSLAGIELFVRLAGDEHCADVIEGGTEKFAASLQTLADQNPKVKKAIERMLEGSAWGQVIFSGMGMVIPIVLHHVPVAGGERAGGIFSRFVRGSEADGSRIGEDNGQPVEVPYADTSPDMD